MHFVTFLGYIHSSGVIFNSIWEIVICAFHCFLFYFLFYSYALTTILAGNIAGTLMIIFYIQLKQLDTFIRSRSRGLRTAQKFATFYRHFIGFLRLLFQCNRWLGSFFTFYIIMVVPSNAYLLVWILFSDILLIWKVLSFFIALGQILIIFGLHFILSIFVRLIHRPAKPLIYLMVCEQPLRRGAWRERVRLANGVELIHTRARLGLTYYGPFGLININSFATVMKPFFVYFPNCFEKIIIWLFFCWYQFIFRYLKMLSFAYKIFHR